VPLSPLQLSITREVSPRSFVVLVIDQTTNRPVSGASVAFSRNIGAFTDSTGVARVRGAPIGANTVTIRRIGFKLLTVEVQIPDTAGVMAAFSLSQETVVLCNVMVTATQ
jgi:hypothetical protein